jgi:hypothetical protein
MAVNNGYEFYFKIGSEVLTFPITPDELTIKVGSNNKTITLVNEGDINILKSPSLIEVEFEARFPMRKYPFSREVLPFKEYFTMFEELKEQRQHFRFIVARATPSGKRTWDTNLLVALEQFEINESADEGDDVLITFKLKQYKEYGVVKIKNGVASSSSGSSSSQTQTAKTYTVKSGDCLWKIAKRFYGDGTKWTVIYDANKKVIEDTAKKYRNGKGSSNGHWIYPGTKLTIPPL